MTRQAPVLMAGLVVVFVMAGVLFLPAPVAAEDDLSPPADEPAVWLVIDIDADGDAHWSIEYRFSVETDEELAAFEELAGAVAAGGQDLPVTAERMDAYRAEAEANTDRDMAIRDARWVDDIEGDVGVLALEFTWVGFAGHTGGSLEVGSAFRSTDGTWLRTLDDGMRLTIIGPTDAPPHSDAPTGATVDGSAVTWNGPHTFESGEIDIRFDAPDDGTGVSSSLLAVAALAVLLIIVGAAVGYKRGAFNRSSASEEAVSTPETPVAIDEELLSDPERVERLLHDNGGRMKQAAIVEETGWSSAKVSQLLSEMADAGRVEKLRIGQENLIALPTPDEGGDED